MNLHVILAVGFLFLKTGEKFATQETAGPTVAVFTEHLAGKLGEKLEPRILNDPAKAIEYITRAKPALGIVTPGFYLTYAKALGMEPVLEVKRQQIAVERYVLVARDKPGVNIATPLAAEPNYVMAVILQGKFGDELRLQPTPDVEGAILAMIERRPDAPSSVLVEEAAWHVLRDDPDLGAQVKAVFTSADLPGNLVVRFHAHAGAIDPIKLKTALLELTGQELLKQIRVEAFLPVDEPRLQKAQERYHGQ